MVIMTRYYKFIMIIISLFVIFTLYQMYNKTATTMKYFPIDTHHSIVESNTELEYDTKQKNINWYVSSTSNQPVYLRQDVSLLYENGVFKGLLNKWRTDEVTIEQQESVPYNQDALLQSVSFHHGEIHNENITSIQAMTDAMLYIIEKDNHLDAFQHPQSPFEKESVKKLTDQTEENLQQQLNRLLTYYEIDASDYIVTSLVDITKQKENVLSSITEENNAKILGQFWEGLYREYITLLMSYEDIPRHYVPFVLIAKDESHVLVLYEIEQEKYKLIQQISAN